MPPTIGTDSRPMLAHQSHGETLEHAGLSIELAAAAMVRTASGGFEVPMRDAPHLSDTRDVQELLHHLDSWPYLHVERRTDCAILRMRDLVVGTLNLVTHALSVNVPPDAVGPMLEGEPPLRRTTGGVSVQVTDIESRTAAETLVRRRIDLERFAWQLRAASP